ncbi:MAG: 2-oxoacid:acceptor oxidoreductase subunit alpha [Vicinamibacterales bacterium]|nr:2-oxoacid:acceptor oxidoreductase subunit alpha [Vicinamibacterales bacterium]
MGTLGVASEEEPVSVGSRSRVVNDFTLQVATVNGSGSQTANLVLLRSIFQMGIPVSGKNMFPSNIAGLPTWYTIRANPKGYIARKKEIDILVAMNPETAHEDVLTLPSGAAVVYDEPLALSGLRHDLICYPVPFDKLVAGVCPDAKLRRLVKNMIYDGVLARLLSIDMGEMEKALLKQLGKKAKAAQLNMGALKAGWDYAEASLPKRDAFSVERMNKTAGMILVEGNAAAAMGCMMAGCTVVGWYPITPSSSLCESLIGYLKKYRKDPDGKATFAAVQAEDEISALGMVIGASWAGARAMTATSGPGISLMSEFVGLGYYAEVPAVIFDVQRVGPSTGLPTRTAQGDILTTAVLSHGDTRHPLLLPSSVAEAYSMAMDAFDLAETLQTPVFVMMDLDLGMNTWMSDPFPYPDTPLDRGKVLSEAKLRQLGAQWGRYADVDGDGIPYRTVPGDGLPPFFTRGSGHNAKAQYSERADDYGNNMDRLARKFDTARRLVPQPEVELQPGSAIGFVAYGTTHFSIGESRDQLRDEQGIATSYYRLRAYPFSDSLGEFIDRHERVYVVEQNRDAQMLALMRMELSPQRLAKIRSVLHYNGLPVDARSITDEVLAHEGLRPPIPAELRHRASGAAPASGAGE